MIFLPGARQARRHVRGACWILLLLVAGSPLLRAQEVGSKNASGDGPAYVQAIELLPSSLAGFVRIPNFPKFCDGWDKTHFGQLMDDESMKPYVESQRDRAIGYLESLGNKVGLRPHDLYDIASGEVVVAWLPFEKDKRRPFALCVIADIRGLRKEADEAVAQIDKDLTAAEWQRMDIEHRGQQVPLLTLPQPEDGGIVGRSLGPTVPRAIV